MPVLIERRGTTYLDVTWISAVTGTALFSRRLPADHRPAAARSSGSPGSPGRKTKRHGHALCYARRRMKARYAVGLLFSRCSRSPGATAYARWLACPSLQSRGQPQVGRDPLAPDQEPAIRRRRSEPEYIWVEEDKIPTTMTTLLLGKSAIIAPPEIVAKYGPPPGGGKISPRQGGPYPTVDPSAPDVDPRPEALRRPRRPAWRRLPAPARPRADARGPGSPGPGGGSGPAGGAVGRGQAGCGWWRRLNRPSAATSSSWSRPGSSSI